VHEEAKLKERRTLSERKQRVLEVVQEFLTQRRKKMKKEEKSV